MSNVQLHKNIVLISLNLNRYLNSLTIYLLKLNIYRCISINYNVVEKFIYFSSSTQIVMILAHI